MPPSSRPHLTVQGFICILSGITNTHLELCMHPECCWGSDDERTLVLLDQACTQLRLCHAMCYYACQGRTISNHHIILLDRRHKHFSIQAHIVGLSRATQGKYLHVGDDNLEALFGSGRRNLEPQLTNEAWPSQLRVCCSIAGSACSPQ